MVRACLLVTFAMVLAACATTAKYEAVLDSWVGSTEEELVAQWGPPDRVYETPGGSRVLTYFRAGNIFIPGTPSSYRSTVVGNTVYTNKTGGTAPVNIELSCTTNMTVTKGRISNWRYEGNNCISR